ncbi:hypothetical protein M413DRAFT_413786 [Hebeloma cylindrosporum]|uniref:CxC6 like cysteine cluster associated with KDZ domain-containing protein n=1 Tax=Hebeloma cylindrosporum TaxID=76867 RepID=A0A0C2YGN3_HEBCY|nr:hypothetical protein M413DRAFT_413786 [Hebeloma cylindrosporum h7]
MLLPYVDSLPQVIEVSEHRFVEARLIHMWRTDMNVSWCAKSATNCARTYSAAYEEKLPQDWPYKASLKGDHIYDGFVIISLLEDHSTRNAILTVPHHGDQAKRFTEAIRARNARMRLYGQPEILHCCDICMRMYEQPGTNPKSVFVAVMDGVTLGHPCCAVHNCKNPLTTARDRFCAEHRLMNSVCAVKKCTGIILEGKRTCGDPIHQEIERIHCVRGQARFQLQERLKRARVAHPNDAVAENVDLTTLADDDDEQAFELDECNRVLPELSPSSQILVAPCGMILARETFYGAEAIATCVEFIKRTFRINGQMPDHIFFDNNCSLGKHVRNDPDFKNVGLTVDVFHFTCKHTTRDDFCQTNCNPALFPELLGKDGKGWYFNSSIAEQTNVWLGGFHAIVREMLHDRYNFFLDEMILLRNRMTQAKLAKGQHCPMSRPRML